MLFLLLFLFNVLLAASLLDEQPYCALRYRRLCQGKGQHVACQFSVPGPGLSCQNYTQIKFNVELRNFITHYINRRRQRVAAGLESVRGGAPLPQPEVMMLVEWDRELSQLAQRLADQCHFVHDDCRATLRYPYAGQTVGEVKWRKSRDTAETSALRAIRRVMDAWWGERRRVTPKQLTQPFRITNKGTVWGHFSQLAVWTLRAAGCGAVRHGATYPRLLLVCDFSHTNMLGQRTIVPGPLAPCPIHTTRRLRSAYPLLCAPVVRHKSKDYPLSPEEHEYEEYETNRDENRTTVEPADITKYISRTLANDIRIREKSEDSDNDGINDMEPDRIIYKDVEADEKAEGVNDAETEGYERQKMRRKGKPDNELTGFEPMEFRGEDIRKSKQESKLDKDQELETRDSVDYKQREKYQHWTRKYCGERRNQVPCSGGVSNRKTRSTSGEAGETSRPYGGRRRWKQTRDRPRRPGANALLSNQVTVLLQSTQPPVSLKMDKDDIEQLYRDTGFKPHSSQQNSKPVDT